MGTTRKQTTTLSLVSYPETSPTKSVIHEYSDLSKAIALSESLPSRSAVGRSSPGNVVYRSFDGQVVKKHRPGLKPINQLISDFESTPDGVAGMSKARQEIARDYYDLSGSPIARARLGKGWSQRKLADAIKSSQPYIARVESGKENIGLQTIAKIADALEIDRGILAAELVRIYE